MSLISVYDSLYIIHYSQFKMLSTIYTRQYLRHYWNFGNEKSVTLFEERAFLHKEQIFLQKLQIDIGFLCLKTILKYSRISPISMVGGG